MLLTTHTPEPHAKPRFDDIFMELAVNLARRSHCIKAQVGAVLTRDTRIISIGYNGPPAGTHNCDEEFQGAGCPRDSKGSCSLALHAEENAILYAAKNGSEIEGATIYVTLSPCIACARIIYSMKIARVIYLHSYAEYKGIPSDEGVDFLRRFGVTVEQYEPGEGVTLLAEPPLSGPANAQKTAGTPERDSTLR
ncbi:dCMP deaminase family protein [Spirosoma aureum]|uniref:dCMP deaminase family protein n=1 Tax=Spirosoma aureum TaxID=2692134 RepID=A0A6G9AQI3_9BACT|nr:dCMP deaminase family protein [Spirosoma aureum]QIP14535.1 dCMP deaminase family protein [Spirosoma aureum]